MSTARFQTFEDNSERAAVAGRVAALRAELKRRGLDGFAVPRADRQQNEYVPASEERLAWLTGFTGSAGFAIVLTDKAALFVDGRYTTQVRDQTDGKVFDIQHLIEQPPDQWLETNLKPGAVLGYDPWLHTTEQAEKLRAACVAAGATLKALGDNPIDAVWKDRPAPPAGMAVLHDVKFAGEAAADKIKRVQAELTKSKSDMLLISDPQAVAWTFNIRGSDIPHVPIALAYAMVPRDGRPSLYIDARKLDNTTRHALEGIAGIREPGRPAARPRGAQGQDRPARPCQRLGRHLAHAGRGRRQGRAWRRSDHTDESHQEPRGNRRLARRAPARRRGDGALPRLVRPGSAVRQAHRNRRRGAAGRLPPRDRPAQGRLVSDNLWQRPERRDRALSRYPRYQPHDRDRRTVPDRFRRAISGRHHRHHPHGHRRRRRSDEMRDRFTRVLKGHIAHRHARFFRKAPAARSSILWRVSRSGRPGSISITAPATASAATSRCTKDRRASPSSARWRCNAA